MQHYWEIFYCKTFKILKNLKDLLLLHCFHCVKIVRIRSYFGQHLHAFGLNTKRYGVSLRIQFKCGKMRTRITLNTDTFYSVFGKIKEQKNQAHLLPYCYGKLELFGKIESLKLWLCDLHYTQWNGNKNR